MITIEKLKIEDLPIINQMFIDFFNEEPDLELCDAPNYFFNDKINQPNSIIYTAKKNNKIVGFLFGLILNSKGYLYKNGLGSLELLYVTKNNRKNGIGKSLVISFENWLKEQNITIYEIACLNENKNGLRFYESINANKIKTIFRKNLNSK